MSSQAWGPGKQPEGGGRPVGTGGTNPSPIAKELRAQELMRLVLEGYSMKNASHIMGVNYMTALKYARDPEWRQQLRDLHSEKLKALDSELIEATRTKMSLIDEIGLTALKKIQAYVDGENPEIQHLTRISDSMLDRLPETSRTKKVDITERKFVITGEDLLRAAQTARELEERQNVRLIEMESSPSDQTTETT